MSVEAPKTVEETPVVDTSKALPEQPEATPAVPETTIDAPVEATPTTDATPVVPTEGTTDAPATEEPKKDEAVVEAVPTSEGVLGYKEPGFFKKFIYTKHFFWFSEEPSTSESLSAFLRQEKEKADTKHSAAAWARETGTGVLFYAKRAEDKAVPAGVINLSEATGVTKEGLQQFSFRVGTHQHRFEATTSKERDSWIVAVEKAVEEAKAIKDEITGRESYKKNFDEYSKPSVIAAAAPTKSARSKSKEPKKSLEAGTATAAATADNASASSASSDEATKAAKKDKERSQSRKRGSIFGSLLGKKEESTEKKEEKTEAKKEVKEEKKAEAEEKKEEAKASDEPTASKAVEAAEASTAAAAVAAAPAAVVASSDKKEEKEEATPSPTTEKKNKRGSVFGSLFKKNVTSPTTEKTEKEATTSDVPPVSETAPKLDEPIENKPIDTAAVTAPADTVETPAATTEEPAKDSTATPATETATTPKAEKKGGILGFIKKTEAKLEGKKETPKEETKAEEAGEAAAKDPVAAAAPAEPSTETPATTETATETPAKEERPARDNTRRTSLFFKNKKDKEATSDAEGATETKREKSPLPGKFIGNLVRRASKAVKSEPPKDKPATETAAAEPATKEEETTTEAKTEAATDAPVAPATEPIESKITGDVVPDDLHATPEPAPAAVPEVKATA